MLLPVYGYGQPVLKKKSLDISPDYPGLTKLIDDMWETMYHAHGVGLAAPQIGLGIRLFVIDTDQIEREGNPGFKKVFINAQVLEESGEVWSYEEGCLSIPDIRGDVERHALVRIRYQDEQFAWHEEQFEGFNARVIQHEYDHIEGVLFTERLKPIRRRLIQRKLEAIRQGKVSADYKIKFAVR
jgi:peptide deformylase